MRSLVLFGQSGQWWVRKVFLNFAKVSYFWGWLDTFSWPKKYGRVQTKKLVKVEKILKRSLDLIPSPPPSVKIQIIGGKVCLKRHCQQTLENKKFVDNTQKCFAFTRQVNFPAHNLKFSLKIKVMGSNPGYLLKSFFTLKWAWKNCKLGCGCT